MTAEPHDRNYEPGLDDVCWQCGGEGVVSNCFEEYACAYPEEGCDLCTYRCDICNPPPRRAIVCDGGEA